MRYQTRRKLRRIASIIQQLALSVLAIALIVWVIRHRDQFLGSDQIPDAFPATQKENDVASDSDERHAPPIRPATITNSRQDSIAGNPGSDVDSPKPTSSVPAGLLANIDDEAVDTSSKETAEAPGANDDPDLISTLIAEMEAETEASDPEKASDVPAASPLVMIPGMLTPHQVMERLRSMKLCRSLQASTIPHQSMPNEWAAGDRIDWTDRNRFKVRGLKWVGGNWYRHWEYDRSNLLFAMEWYFQQLDPEKDILKGIEAILETMQQCVVAYDPLLARELSYVELRCALLRHGLRTRKLLPAMARTLAAENLLAPASINEATLQRLLVRKDNSGLRNIPAVQQLMRTDPPSKRFLMKYLFSGLPLPSSFDLEQTGLKARFDSERILALSQNRWAPDESEQAVIHELAIELAPLAALLAGMEDHGLPESLVAPVLLKQTYDIFGNYSRDVASLLLQGIEQGTYPPPGLFRPQDLIYLAVNTARHYDAVWAIPMYCLVQHQVITSDATEGKAWYHDRFNAMESILYIRRESMRICSAFGDESFYHHCQAMCDVAEEIAFNPADREHFPASWGHRWMVLEAKLLFASRASRSRDFYPLYDQLIENDEVLTSVRFIATWKRAHLAGKDGDITLARNLWRRIADGEFGTYGDRGRALEQIQQLQNQ